MKRWSCLSAAGLDIGRETVAAVVLTRTGTRGFRTGFCIAESIRNSSDRDEQLRSVLERIPGHIPVIPVVPGYKQMAYPQVMPDLKSTMLKSDLNGDLKNRIPFDPKEFIMHPGVRRPGSRVKLPAYLAFRNELESILDRLTDSGFMPPGAIPFPVAHRAWIRHVRGMTAEDILLCDISSEQMRVTALRRDHIVCSRIIIRPESRFSRELELAVEAIRKSFPDWNPGEIQLTGDRHGFHADSIAAGGLDLPVAVGFLNGEGGRAACPSAQVACGAAAAFLIHGQKFCMGYPPSVGRPVRFFRFHGVAWLAAIWILVSSAALNLNARTHILHARTAALRAAVEEMMKPADGFTAVEWRAVEELTGIATELSVRELLFHVSQVQEDGIQIDRIRGSGSTLAVSGLSRDFAAVGRFAGRLRETGEGLVCEVVSTDRSGGRIRFELNLSAEGVES
ncbi:hypothetical protein JXA40_11975 [bacterium]|nr:hypothetical protein [candidate division CSSED10-310 bacterium]